MRPDQSPLETFVTAPLATDIRNAALRAREFAPKRIDWPSAAHVYWPIAASNEAFSLRGSPPPSAGTTHSLSSARSHDVSLGARYESTLPSGDHWTSCSGALLCVTGRSAPVAVSTTAISARFWPLRAFSRRKIIAIFFASGDTRKLSMMSASSCVTTCSRLSASATRHSSENSARSWPFGPSSTKIASSPAFSAAFCASLFTRSARNTIDVLSFVHSNALILDL